MNKYYMNAGTGAAKQRTMQHVKDIDKFFVAKRNGKTYHNFFLIKPKQGMDVNALANDIASLPDVLEVYATEGPIGFMVKACFDSDKKPEEVADYIEKNVSKDYGTLVSYINFKQCQK
ncbi:Lrp/AsnC ligand binding domain-containing protein [Candidatus Marsarchaeota archaeon]|nr:Lrp/AsnC ligand binding domain-containing protein [Candidatus Marsarchaeota archaeon]MCL5404702.1 Lrp/AsnC ligand binding domain-containing protein [Candidatus Marsarchaeota archaeon]